MGVLKTYEAAKKLCQLSFFKRYSPEVIKEFLPKIKIDILKKNQLIIVSKREGNYQASTQIKDPNDHHKSINRQSFFERNIGVDKNRKVYIILSGCIVAKDHDSDVLLPQTLAKFIQGKLYSSLL
jgi:hypothetical protein